MAVPFKSTVFTGGSFSASGSNGHSSAGLLIYSASRTDSGLMPAADLAAVGRDVFLYISGVAGSRGTSNPGTVVIGGDLLISGTAYDVNGNVIEGNPLTFLYSTTAGSVYTTGSFAFVGNESGVDSPLDKGADVNFYVKGTAGSRGTGTAGTALFSGDLYVSGTVYSNEFKSTIISSSIIYSSGSTLFGNSADDTHTFIGNITGSGDLQVNGNTNLGNSQADRTSVTGSLYVTGSVNSAVISGSLTRLTTGLSYLVAGSNVTIATASNGQVTIASTGGGGGASYFDSVIAGATYATGSLALAGTEGITNAASKGTDVFFYASGSAGSRGTAAGKIALFRGDTVVSGSSYVSGSLYVGLDASRGRLSYDNAYSVFTVESASGKVQISAVNYAVDVSSVLYNTDGTWQAYSTAYTLNNYDTNTQMLSITEPGDMGDVIFEIGRTDFEAAELRVNGQIFASGSITSLLPYNYIKSEGGFSGSLTRLADGRSYLAAGSNVTITSESNGQVTISSSGGGGGSPGGSNTHVQFNDSGSFGAISGLAFEKATSTLTGVTISATTGFTGSHTKLADGTSLITAGVTSTTSQTGSIAVTTGSSGQITVASYVFPSDLTVSLSGGRTFGRYATGETIPATGKTPAEVILLAIAQPINPTVATPTATNILTSVWNTTGSVNTSLTGSYTINTLGASVASARLEFRSGSSGAFSILTTSTSTPLLFDHTFTVGANFTSTLNYSHIVVDSAGAVATGSVTLTPQTYTAPTIPTITLARTTLGGITGESNTTRERGNTVSAITGTITRQRTNAPLSSYAVQYRVDSAGAYIGVPGLSGSIPAASSTFTFMGLHDEASLITSVSSSLVYIVSVVDTFQTSSITPSSNGITFLSAIFYGTGSAAPTTSADVRSLPNKVFTTTANPFTLNTGATNRFFTVALPTRNTSHDAITSVTDTDALGADITANYVNSAFSVGDGGGVNSTYNVYTMEVATPYAADHRHIVTRA